MSRLGGTLVPGQTASVGFTISDPAVANIGPNPITVVRPDVNLEIFVTRLKSGSATVSINPVPGFASDPALQTFRVPDVN